MLVSASLLAAPSLDKAAGYRLNHHNGIFRKLGVGSIMSSGHWLKGQWDYSVQGGAAGSTLSLVDLEGEPVYLPNNAIIKDCLIDVVTVPTSSTSSAKISFNSNAVADLKASTAIYPTYQTADTPIACIPTGSAALAIKMASEGILKMSVGSEALTAGKINVWVEYTLSD